LLQIPKSFSLLTHRRAFLFQFITANIMNLIAKDEEGVVGKGMGVGGKGINFSFVGVGLSE